MHSEEEEQKHLGEIEVQLSYCLVGLHFHLIGLYLSRRWFTSCIFSQVHLGQNEVQPGYCLVDGLDRSLWWITSCHSTEVHFSNFEVQLGYRLAGLQNYLSGLEPQSVKSNPK